jgi:hypothetical protein
MVSSGPLRRESLHRGHSRRLARGLHESAGLSAGSGAHAHDLEHQAGLGIDLDPALQEHLGLARVLALRVVAVLRRRSAALGEIRLGDDRGRVGGVRGAGGEGREDRISSE